MYIISLHLQYPKQIKDYDTLAADDKFVYCVKKSSTNSQQI